MILEAYIWALSKAVPGARKAGLVHEVAGIAGRFQRCKTAWRNHLNNSRKLIAAHILKADPNEPILVLGAGLGLDLPFEALNAHKSGALLCDAVETPTLRKKLRGLDNLSFEASDLTGLLTQFWGKEDCDTIVPPRIAPIPLTGYSMVISCNILSQLPLSFANSPPVGDTEIRLTVTVQQAHILALKAMQCPALLITDYERRDTTAGETQLIPSVAPQLLPEEQIAKWDWPVAPTGELAKDREVILKVGTWLLRK